MNISEIAIQGSDVYRVNGLIDDCGKIVGQGKEEAGWFDFSTLKEPYGSRARRRWGWKLAEQLGWEVPDAIFYPTGGGTGLIGMWKAFDELEKIGFIGSKRPRMIAVQAEGCAPIVRAYEAGEEHAPRWEDAQTIAWGVRVPQAVGDFLILRAVRESGGYAMAVSDRGDHARPCGSGADGGAAALPGKALRPGRLTSVRIAEGRIGKHERVMLFQLRHRAEIPAAARRAEPRPLASADRLRALRLRASFPSGGFRLTDKNDAPGK